MRESFSRSAGSSEGSIRPKSNKPGIFHAATAALGMMMGAREAEAQARQPQEAYVVQSTENDAEQVQEEVSFDRLREVRSDLIRNMADYRSPKEAPVPGASLVYAGGSSELNVRSHSGPQDGNWDRRPVQRQDSLPNYSELQRFNGRVIAFQGTDSRLSDELSVQGFSRVESEESFTAQTLRAYEVRNQESLVSARQHVVEQGIGASADEAAGRAFLNISRDQRFSEGTNNGTYVVDTAAEAHSQLVHGGRLTYQTRRNLAVLSNVQVVAEQLPDGQWVARIEGDLLRARVSNSNRSAASSRASSGRR